jgi:DNA gyrase subunit A
MKSIKTSERNGQQIGAVLVEPTDEVMLITDGGTLVRTPVSDISELGRDTQGVRMIRLSKDEKLIGIARVLKLAGEDDESEDGLDTDEAESDDSESDSAE